MNKHATQIADQELYKRHPGLVDPVTGKPRKLTMSKADEPYRKEWLMYYKAVDEADKKRFGTCTVKGVTVACPSPKGKEWDQLDVLKILCKEEPWVVGVLAHPLAKTHKIGRILYMDKKFNIDAAGNPIGDPIDVRVFEGGGSNSAANREINALAGESPEEVAATLVHEARHQVQDKKKLKTWEDQEIDAYMVGEEYRIKRGLSPHAPGFRTKDPATGKEVPDRVAIETYVKKEYPVDPQWFPGDEIDEDIKDVSSGWDCSKVP